jgi:hypothetical protein
MMPTTKTDLIYNPPEDERIRYMLKKPGNNPLFVICLHSPAFDDDKPDRTFNRAKKIAENKFEKFDELVMFNLYPLRVRNTSELPDTDEQKLLGKNIAAIEEELSKVTKPTIWAAWGEDIEEKVYFGECLQKIVRLPAVHGATWQHFDDLTKDGHPRQPLFANDNANVSKFDIEEYVKTLK